MSLSFSSFSNREKLNHWNTFTGSVRRGWYSLPNGRSHWNSFRWSVPATLHCVQVSPSIAPPDLQSFRSFMNRILVSFFRQYIIQGHQSTHLTNLRHRLTKLVANNQWQIYINITVSKYTRYFLKAWRIMYHALSKSMHYQKNLNYNFLSLWRPHVGTLPLEWTATHSHCSCNLSGRWTVVFLGLIVSSGFQ